MMLIVKNLHAGHLNFELAVRNLHVGILFILDYQKVEMQSLCFQKTNAGLVLLPD
jgi:hypothetical protein